MQPARRGHRKLLCSADEKVASGWVATALRAAVAELWFLSTHSGSKQGCGRGSVGWGREIERARAKGTGRGGDRVESEDSRMHRKDTMERGARERPERQRRGEDSKRNRHLRFVQQPRASRPPLSAPGEHLRPQKMHVPTHHFDVTRPWYRDAGGQTPHKCARV